jgi:hypothetical protein
MSLTVWDGDEGPRPEPPPWMLTGHMLLWSDGSPAHVDMEHFKPTDAGWEAQLMISRSAASHTRWLTLRMLLSKEVRREWEAQGTSARARALQQLSNYLRLREWYDDDLGVLDLA